MKSRLLIGVAAMSVSLSGCAMFERALCAPNCRTEAHNSSSLVSFLYPGGETPPPNNSIPQLHVPLRIGLAFLPSTASNGAAPLDAARRQDLLERIRQRFSTREFISEIVVIPEYYLDSNKGIAGLDGVQRLYNIDLLALVSYDQVTHKDENKLSLGYLTIVGAYVLRGSSHDTATLVDLAVIDPVTRSLVLRAGGTNTSDGKSTLVDVERDVRKASVRGFDEATNQMIGNFDVALAAFEADARAGKANVQVVRREDRAGFGGGAVGGWEVLGLLLLIGGRQALQRFRAGLS